MSASIWRAARCLALFALVTAGCTTYTTVQAPTTTAPSSAGAPAAAPIARLGLTVSSTDGNVALKGQSIVTLDGRASTGSGLRFSLDFGDGAGVDDAIATHIYTGDGLTYSARLVVTDSVGRTDEARAAVSVASVLGIWGNGMYNSRTQRYESRALRIVAQNGRALTGFYRHPESDETPMLGELLGDRGFRMHSADGFIDFSSKAAGLNRSANSVDMLVRGGSADGFTLTFSR